MAFAARSSASDLLTYGDLDLSTALADLNFARTLRNDQEEIFLSHSPMALNAALGTHPPTGDCLTQTDMNVDTTRRSTFSENLQK